MEQCGDILNLTVENIDGINQHQLMKLANVKAGEVENILRGIVTKARRENDTAIYAYVRTQKWDFKNRQYLTQLSICNYLPFY